jgi:RimJ/RimL family protein N-acetyltransferase
MRTAELPDVIYSERLCLRAWRTEDAPVLLPLLEANVQHLGSWIPAHVASPAPLHEIVLRLVGFADDFAAGRSWRWGVFAGPGRTLIGEASLFPRSAEGRVHCSAADRMEIGYWLDRAATGRGYATEAARTLVDLALSIPGIDRVEIHCDPRNRASAAVPRRLGFELVDSGATAAPGEAGMVWAHSR